MKWRSLILPAILTIAMASASALGYGMRPHIFLADVSPINLETAVPHEFGNWKELPNAGKAIVDPGVQRLIDEAYTQTVTRNYVDPDGYVVMLSLAYGRDQRGAQMAHRPDVCYPAQGFRVEPLQRDSIKTAFGSITTEHMLARQGARTEPVTFWFTVGDQALDDAMQRRLVSVRYGLKGLIPDGMLFRISSIDETPARAYQRQADFVQALTKSLDPAIRSRVTGL
jgi:EpsI family protein